MAVVYAFITDALIRSRLLQTLGRRTVPGGIHDHVIVVGLGLDRLPGRPRDRRRAACRSSPSRSATTGGSCRRRGPPGIPVFIGDARHPEVLDELRLGTARAIVAATSDDLVNLSVALNARKARPDLRVVVRLYDPDFATRVQRGFGIRFTRSVSHLAAPAFAAAAVRSEVIATVPVGDRRVDPLRAAARAGRAHGWRAGWRPRSARPARSASSPSPTRAPRTPAGTSRPTR